ncbi:MAG: hypothetical protein ACREDR_43340, partial [Blastocatellia bacterium]
MTSSKSTVTVTFIDDATGESIRVAEIPPYDLPESFEPRTTIDIGDTKWTVVEASPLTRAEYLISKALTLRLSRVEPLGSREIFFSLPSICDPIPGISDEPNDGTEFIIADDDWRQFEFVSSALSDEVDEEIAQIRLIHQNASAKVGWREIHVRKEPSAPLVCTLTLDDLARRLNAPEPGGVTYQGARTRIQDGYSLIIKDGVTVYGVAPNRSVEVIALNQY